MQVLNRKKAFSERRSEDGRKWYCQDGLEYDLRGQPLDKKAVIKRANENAADIQDQANAAMEAAQKAQADADVAKAELLKGGEPTTIKELTQALEAAGVEIPKGSRIADLEQLWNATKAA